jgi:DNA-binding LacI/PurR family transcriptional regulator
MPRNHVKPYRRTEVRQRIEEMIRRGDLWGQRLSGQRELATELDVCRRTLEQALAEMEADGLIERRHGSGTFVSKRPPAAGRSRRIVRLAVIAETHWEAAPGWNYYGEMIRSVLGLAPRLRAECEVLALDRPEERARLEDGRELRRFAGFISVVVLDRGLLSRLAALGRGPVVLLDHQIRDLPITCVVDGSFEGARAVTKHLLGLGHRRIAFLDHDNRAESNPEKFAGYAAALAEAGIGTDERMVVVPPELDWQAPGETQAAGVVDSAVAGLLALDDPPTALFGFDDYRALPSAGPATG